MVIDKFCENPPDTHNGRPSHRGTRDYQRMSLPDTHNARGVHELEAVVFVPGFNSCLNNALETFAQFLTLARYPDYIIPVRT